MVDSPTAPAPDGAGVPPLISVELHRSGPWIGVYQQGTDAIAELMVNACTERGVSTDCHPIDKMPKINLDRYTGFFGIIATVPEGTRPIAWVGPIVDLVSDFRIVKPHGLRSVIDGTHKWHDAGVPQVVAPRALLDHPEVRAALGACDGLHFSDDVAPADLFLIYDNQVPLRAVVTELDTDPLEPIRIAWAIARSWGITDQADVPILLRRIETSRRHFDDDRFTQLSRPINRHQNRLDHVLEGPRIEGRLAPEIRKAWMENGARACRYLLGELQRDVPHLTRPGSAFKRGLQEDVRQLYRALRIISAFADNADPEEVRRALS